MLRAQSLALRTDHLTVSVTDRKVLVQRVVHFQHTLFLASTSSRNGARRCRRRPGMYYTLHEYLPICHRNGQMVRTQANELCSEASPQRCHACFPDIPEQSFFLRKRFIASHLARVDQFSRAEPLSSRAVLSSGEFHVRRFGMRSTGGCHCSLSRNAAARNGIGLASLAN